MNIEEHIRSLLEQAEQPTAAQLAYPGATSPQDPAPYMGVAYEMLEFDRPGVVTDEIQQAQYPGQTAQDPAPVAQAQAVDPAVAGAQVPVAAQPAPNVAVAEPAPLAPEFLELDPYDISSHVDQVAKENYPVGSGADDVSIAPDANGVADDEFSKGIKQAAAPAPMVEESVQDKPYSVLKPRKISARSEGKVVEVKAPADVIEKKLGLPAGELKPVGSGPYSKTAVVQDKRGLNHTIYADGDSVRIRSYGHSDAAATNELLKHLTESDLNEGRFNPNELPLKPGSRKVVNIKDESELNNTHKDLIAAGFVRSSSRKDPDISGKNHYYKHPTEKTTVCLFAPESAKLNEETESDGQDDVMAQAVAAVQAGNDVDEVAKATGLDVQAIKDAIDAAQPTASPSAPTTTAPVSEAFKKTTSGPVYKEAIVYHKGPHVPGRENDMLDAVDTAGELEVSEHPTIEGFIRSKAHDKDGMTAYKTVTHFPGQEWTARHIKDISNIVNADLAIGHNPVADDGKGKSVYEGTTDMKQDIDAVLAEETLSEEFKTKAAGLFEAAVIARVNNEAQRIEEAFDKKLETEINSLQEQYVKATESFAEKQSVRLSNYMDYLGEQWIKQNRVAVTEGIRTELTEGFMSGLKTLFSQHYMSAPQEKLDMVAEQKLEIEKLQESMAEAASKLEMLAEENQVLQRNAVIHRLSEGMTDVEVAKLESLCEGMEFGSEDLFEAKVEMVKTNFFKRKSVQSPEQLLESTVHANQPQAEPAPAAKTETPKMQAYVDALNRFKPY